MTMTIRPVQSGTQGDRNTKQGGNIVAPPDFPSSRLKDPMPAPGSTRVEGIIGHGMPSSGWMRRPARMAVVVILMSGFGASCVTWTDREADTRLGPAPLPETGAPAAAAAPARAAGPLILSVQQAVLTTIENNRSLRVQRFECCVGEQTAVAVAGYDAAPTA